jgi:hypothetical protein
MVEAKLQNLLISFTRGVTTNLENILVSRFVCGLDVDFG